MTPTGADAMKEAEDLARHVRLAVTMQCINGSEKNVRACDEADAALMAYIRKLVEAQPAAEPSADALAVADAAGWDRAIKEGMREIEAERASPAAPAGVPPGVDRLLRELRAYCEANQGTYIFPSWDGHRVLKYLGPAIAGGEQKAGSVHPSAAGAGNAGVRNAE